MLDWRLKAYRHWLTMQEPHWAHLRITPIDYQAISYYSAPKSPANAPKSLEEVDPKLLATYDKLGIPLHERARLAGVAVDAVFDSVSVATTFKERLGKAGVIFCSFSEAVQKYPALVEKYLGTVVPYTDNYFATLNSAVFTDGSFVFVPKGVRCPMELSTYFRINAAKTGQFERTLIIAEEGAHVSYLEGCTAPMRDENQLHAAVVELVALENAQIKYSTVQNWYPGDEHGRGGIYNFVTKRGECRGANSRISWTQVETGSAITWKYPSCILTGDNSVGEFYSVAVANNYQQADTGTKMIHIGRNTRSTIVSKGISAGHGQNSYRGLVKVLPSAVNARNHTQCDSLLMGDKCGAHTFPYMEVRTPTASVEHEATTSKIGDDQLFYCLSRGISEEDAVNMIVNGFCKVVFKELPMEFAVEAQNLLAVSLEGSVG
jgi:Fe-S cluster assembly protein SufB